MRGVSCCLCERQYCHHLYGEGLHSSEWFHRTWNKEINFIVHILIPQISSRNILYRSNRVILIVEEYIDPRRHFDVSCSRFVLCAHDFRFDVSALQRAQVCIGSTLVRSSLKNNRKNSKFRRCWWNDKLNAQVVGGWLRLVLCLRRWISLSNLIRSHGARYSLSLLFSY